MDRDLKNGILLIVIGLLIPLAVLPFVKGLFDDKGWYERFYKSSVELRTDTPGSRDDQDGPKPSIMESLSRRMPASIPFRFFLVPTVILLYLGIVRVDRARRRARGEHDPFGHEDNDSSSSQ